MLYITGTHIFLTFSFLIFGLNLFAQLQQPKRLEIPMQSADDYFDVIPAKENGLVLYREIKNLDTRMEQKYQVILLDSSLNITWESNYFINLRYIHIQGGASIFGNYFYLLFQRNTESLNADLFVVRIDLDTKISETFHIEREYFMELTIFEVLGNTLIFGGNSNKLPIIIYCEFGKTQPKVLPGFFSKNTQIHHVEIDDDLRTLDVLVNFRTKDGRSSLSLKSFDEFGELIKNINLQPSEGHSLLFGKTVKLDRNSELIIGAYTNTKVRTYTNTKTKSELSRGIYLARISQEGDQIVNYYNYADLKNFFNYMKARKQRRIEKRIKRRKVKGKKIKFNYQILVHEVVEQDGKFIMVGETFYPKCSGVNGSVFEGYKYTHAVVFGFDRRGRLIWDNSFEINDVISYTLDQFVHISISEKEIALIYMYENEIRTKIIKGKEVLEGKASNELKLSFENDVVSSIEDEYGGLEEWYDGNLFAYGIQKNKKQKRQRSKTQSRSFLHK